MSHQISIGFVDYTKLVFIPDPASTDGSGKTGLVAANLTVSYTRVETDNDVTVTDVTSSLNNLAALTTAHTDWGVLEVSPTLAPGLYRLDIADAVFAAGAWTAVVYVMITTSAAAPSPVEFELVAFNKLDGVRLGLTALPNAAADAAGGLPISDAGGLDLDARLDAAVSSRMATYTQPTGFLAATFPASVASPTNITAGIITTVTNLTNAPTAGDLTATMKTSVTTAATAATPTAAAVTGAVGSVTAGVTVTTNNDKTGYGLSAAAVQAIWDALTSALTAVGSIGKLLVDNINATISSRLASASYTTPPTIAEIRTELDSNSTKLANLDATISSRTKPADTQAAVTLVATTTNLTNLPATAALEATLTAMKGGTFNGVTDSLEAIRDRGDAAWTTATGFSTHSASDVWAVGTRRLTDGTNIVLAKGVGVTGFNDLSAAQVNAEADTALADYDGPTHAGMTASFAAIASAISSLNNISASDVWSFGTRILTAGTNIVLAKGTGVTGFNDLSAAQVNSEADTAIADVGLTSTVTGRIDVAVSTRLASAGYTAPDNATITLINDKTTNLPSDPADQSLIIAAIAALVIPSANANADALLDRADGVETNRTLRQAMRIILAATAGKASGLAGTSVIYRDTNDTVDRITATVDASGNRSAVTLNAA